MVSTKTEPLDATQEPQLPMADVEPGASGAEGDCTFSLDYASVAKHFTGAVRHDVRDAFDALSASAVLGEWCPVGAQKLRHWAPKGARWDEEKQWFFFDGEKEEEEYSSRSMLLHMATCSVREAALDPEERRRACKLWERFEERFTHADDARALARALAGLTFEGRRVEVFRHTGAGVKTVEASFEGTKKEREPKRARAAAEPVESREEKRVCGESSAERRLQEKEEVELLERKARAEREAAAAKRDAFPMTALEMVGKEYPGLELRERIFRARQIVSYMTAGQVEAQAGTEDPIPNVRRLSWDRSFATTVVFQRWPLCDWSPR